MSDVINLHIFALAMLPDIPLTLRKALTLDSTPNLELVEILKNPSLMIHLAAKTIPNDFYFKIAIPYQNQKGQYEYRVYIKPEHKDTINEVSFVTSIEAIITHLNMWLNLLRETTETLTVFDDPILNSYQKEFEEQYQILDKDAHVSPFNFKQQTILHAYLETVIGNLEESKIGKSNDEVIELENLKQETKDLQKNITKETKRNFIKKLTRIWAKAQKIGFDVIKKIAVDVSADIVKKTLLGG